MLNRFESITVKALCAFTALNMIALAAMVIIMVAARYVFEVAIFGLHELILLAAMQVYLIGALLASGENAHLDVDWLDAKITSPRVKALHSILLAVLTIVVCLFFVYWTWKMLGWAFARPQWSPSLGIPIWAPQLSVLLCAVGSLLFAARDLTRTLITLKGTAR